MRVSQSTPGPPAPASRCNMRPAKSDRESCQESEVSTSAGAEKPLPHLPIRPCPPGDFYKPTKLPQFLGTSPIRPTRTVVKSEVNTGVLHSCSR